MVDDLPGALVDVLLGLATTVLSHGGPIAEAPIATLASVIEDRGIAILTDSQKSRLLAFLRVSEQEVFASDHAHDASFLRPTAAIKISILRISRRWIQDTGDLPTLAALLALAASDRDPDVRRALESRHFG